MIKIAMRKLAMKRTVNSIFAAYAALNLLFVP
jgi:hypothetical protein